VRHATTLNQLNRSGQKRTKSRQLNHLAGLSAMRGHFFRPPFFPVDGFKNCKKHFQSSRRFANCFSNFFRKSASRFFPSDFQAISNFPKNDFSGTRAAKGNAEGGKFDGTDVRNDGKPGYEYDRNVRQKPAFH
jgi:hypothetical protein